MNTVFKTASYASKHKGKIIEVSLWSEEVNGSPIVIITDGEEAIPLSLQELRGLSLSILQMLAHIEK